MTVGRFRKAVIMPAYSGVDIEDDMTELTSEDSKHYRAINGPGS